MTRPTTATHRRTQGNPEISDLLVMLAAHRSRSLRPRIRVAFLPEMQAGWTLQWQRGRRPTSRETTNHRYQEMQGTHLSRSEHLDFEPSQALDWIVAKSWSWLPACPNIP